MKIISSKRCSKKIILTRDGEYQKQLKVLFSAMGKTYQQVN